MRKKNELVFGTTLISCLLDLTNEIFAHLPTCPVSPPFSLSKGFPAGGPPTHLPPPFPFPFLLSLVEPCPAPLTHEEKREHVLVDAQYFEPVSAPFSCGRKMEGQWTRDPGPQGVGRGGGMKISVGAQEAFLV